MPKWRVVYKDDSTVEVHAPNESTAKKHAESLVPAKPIKEIKKLKP